MAIEGAVGMVDEVGFESGSVDEAAIFSRPDYPHDDLDLENEHVVLRLAIVIFSLPEYSHDDLGPESEHVSLMSAIEIAHGSPGEILLILGIAIAHARLCEAFLVSFDLLHHGSCARSAGVCPRASELGIGGLTGLLRLTIACVSFCWLMGPRHLSALPFHSSTEPSIYLESAFPKVMPSPPLESLIVAASSFSQVKWLSIPLALLLYVLQTEVENWTWSYWQLESAQFLRQILHPGPFQSDFI